MDCIRISTKLQDLEQMPKNELTLWTPLHLCTFNLIEMTVVMDSKPTEIQTLEINETSERLRGDQSLKIDATNSNLNSK